MERHDDIGLPAIGEVRQRIEELIRERDEATEDAARQTAGMKQVALFRAANNQGLLGSYAMPLLRALEREGAESERLRDLLREATADQMGGTPDLFAPEAGWDDWNRRVQEVLDGC